MKGVLLIATGSSNYAKMAAALAATIRVCDPHIPITLCYSCNLPFNEQEWALFNLVKINEQGLKAKLMLPELSPYDETLYLDVDIAWMTGKIEDMLKDCGDFCIKNYGYQQLNTQPNDPKYWASYSDIALIYRLGEEKSYHISSEAIYFKKTKEVKKMFKDALKVYDKPKVVYKTFAGGIADELCLSIAMMQNKLYPAIDKWEPVWWIQSSKAKPAIHLLREKFNAISMGGIRAVSQVEQMYNNLVSAAYQQLGVSNPYKWINKYKFLKERQDI